MRTKHGEHVAERSRLPSDLFAELCRRFVSKLYRRFVSKLYHRFVSKCATDLSPNLLTILCVCGKIYGYPVWGNSREICPRPKMYSMHHGVVISPCGEDTRTLRKPQRACRSSGVVCEVDSMSISSSHISRDSVNMMHAGASYLRRVIEVVITRRS